jgi:hypothetical protein
VQHLFGCRVSEQLSGPVIKSFFNQNQLLIGRNINAPLLEYVLTQHTNEGLVATTLPAAI